jgi:hypothetical protein
VTPDPEPEIPVAAPKWKGKERRKEPRERSDRKVRVIMPGRGITIHGILKNLSESGCCVDPDEPILIWDSVRVEVRLEAFQLQFKLAGITKGNRGGKSFGIEFEGMSAEKIAQLKLLLPPKRKPAVTPGAAGAEAAPAALTEEEERILEEQQKALQAKKRAAMVRMDGPPRGIERRVAPRYIIEAEGVMQIVQSGEMMTAYVLEMSMTGCRLHLDVPYEKGLGVHVELSFHVHGMPVRLAARTQVQMNPQTIGVKFFEGSERSKARMTELIGEIREAIAAGEARATASAASEARMAASEKAEEEAALKAASNAEAKPAPESTPKAGSSPEAMAQPDPNAPPAPNPPAEPNPAS